MRVHCSYTYSDSVSFAWYCVGLTHVFPSHKMHLKSEGKKSDDFGCCILYFSHFFLMKNADDKTNVQFCRPFKGQ